MSNYYKKGSYKAQCDICGVARKRDVLKKTWKGLLACIDKGCWDPKHPNDNPRKAVQDNYPVPDARPRKTISIVWPGSGLIVWESSLLWSDPQATWDDDLNTLSLTDLIGL